MDISSDTMLVTLTVGQIEQLIGDIIARKQRELEEKMRKEAEQDDIIKGSEAIARYLGVAKSTMFGMMEELVGEQACFYVGRSIRARKSDLVAYMKRHSIQYIH